MPWQPDYVTAKDLADYLDIGDNQDDPELLVAAGAASRAVDYATNRQFGQVDTAEPRQYELEWSRSRGLWVAKIDDLVSTNDLVITVSGSALTPDQYALTPKNAPQNVRPWERIGVVQGTAPTLGVGPPLIDMTAEWGWTGFPNTIVQATLLQAARFFKRKDAPFGIAGSPSAAGTDTVRLLDKADPDVALMVRYYRRDHPMVA